MEWIQKYLTSFGVKSRLIFTTNKQRASLFAKIGNKERPDIILSGHLDVVPADGKWSYEPFKLTKLMKRFYGRGTTDMKGAIAVALSCVPYFLKSNKTICLIFTHNEETSRSAILEVLNDKEVFNHVKGASGCIVMEATSLKVIIGEKTAITGKITVNGKTAHSSNPSFGVNALKHAVNIYNIFYTISDAFKKDIDRGFNVPYCVADITLFNSGSAINMIPDCAEMHWVGRFLSQKQEDSFINILTNKINDYAKKNSIEVKTELNMKSLGFSSDINENFIRKVLSIIDLAKECKVSYGTEAGCFSSLKIPTVIFGPGNIKQAHTADEFIEKDELESFADLLKHIINVL